MHDCGGGAMRYGDLANWLSGVGTLGALVLSLALLFRQRQNARISQRRQQAELVAGWEDRFESQADPFPVLFIRVRNGSELPVYMLQLRVSLGVCGTFVRSRPALAPGETREFPIPLPSLPHGDLHSPEIKFTDVRTVTWHRSGAGVLREVPKDEILLFEDDPGAYELFDHPTLMLPDDERYEDRRI